MNGRRRLRSGFLRASLGRLRDVRSVRLQFTSIWVRALFTEAVGKKRNLKQSPCLFYYTYHHRVQRMIARVKTQLQKAAVKYALGLLTLYPKTPGIAQNNNHLSIYEHFKNSRGWGLINFCAFFGQTPNWKEKKRLCTRFLAVINTRAQWLIFLFLVRAECANLCACEEKETLKINIPWTPAPAHAVQFLILKDDIISVSFYYLYWKSRRLRE